MTITWSIAQLDRNVPDGGVTVVHWRVDAVDGDHVAALDGGIGFTPDPTSPTFVPYDQLTETDVLAWVWRSVDKDATEASLAQRIEAKKTPVTLNGLPW
jgi:hypothetical protein